MAEESELYFDPIQKRMRPRRGHKSRVKRGPYSAEEEGMITGFDNLLSAQRRMHGRLAQWTCIDITRILARLEVICERYSYESTGSDVTGINPHIVMEEIDWQPYDAVDPPEDLDIYKDLS